MSDQQSDAEVRYRTCPGLRVDPIEGSEMVKVVNQAFDVEYEAHPDLLEILSALRTPLTRRELRERFEFDDAMFEHLIAKWTVMPEGDVKTLAPGLTSPAAQPLGLATTYDGLREMGAPGTFVVLGAPLDVLGVRGASAGPAEVRRYSVFRDLRPTDPRALPEHMHLVDLDRRTRFSLGPGNRQAVVDVGDARYIGGEPIEHVAVRLERLVERIVERQMIPVMLGGDHSLSVAPLKVLLARHQKLGIIHFDAHHDLYPNPSAHQPLTHANPFEHVRKSPALARLHQLGLRTVERYDTVSHAIEPDERVTYRSARELQRLSPEEAFEGLDRSLPWYLSFDVDCLCPSEAPETGTPAVGGLRFHQALDLVQYAIEHFKLVGADFVEVGAPRTPGHNLAAEAVGRLLDLLLMSRLESSPLDAWIYRRRSLSSS